MKCLSVSQPFAELIISGRKKIELRSWNTKFRGEFLIHSPMSIRKQDCRRLKITQDANMLVRGAIVGKAEIYDVKVYESASQLRKDHSMHHAKIKFDRRMYGFMLKDSIRFRVPIPYKGMLGFFEATLPRVIQDASNSDSLVSDIIDEEHRYRLVGHHWLRLGSHSNATIY